MNLEQLIRYLYYSNSKRVTGFIVLDNNLYGQLNDS